MRGSSRLKPGLVTMILNTGGTDTVLEMIRDEYISVLLELYSTKHEMLHPSPSELYKVNFWKIRVNDYEKEMFPEEVRGRVIYRVRKGEKQGLNPIQLALIRYAWYAFLSESESGEEVKKRWQGYFVDKEHGEARQVLVDHDEFFRRRSFFDLVSVVKKSELWPWVD